MVAYTLEEKKAVRKSRNEVRKAIRWVEFTRQGVLSRDGLAADSHGKTASYVIKLAGDRLLRIGKTPYHRQGKSLVEMAKMVHDLAYQYRMMSRDDRENIVNVNRVAGRLTKIQRALLHLHGAMVKDSNHG